MAKFVVGRPLTTRESSVVVDAGLPVGIHRFQLVVIGAGGASKPDQILVQVQATRLIPDIRTSPVTPLRPLQPLTPLSPRTSRRKGKPS
jgi:hypothetical protein